MEVAKTQFTVNNYAIIILAAGSSSRLGKPKQLLPYRDKNLLQHAIDQAKKTKAFEIRVVLGASKELIKQGIDQSGIVIVENPNWESGLASSIKAGVQASDNRSTQIDAIILMVCDQPFAETDILQSIIDTQLESGKAIVGSTYADTKGIPALFHSSIFPELLSLEGDHGAKKLFEKYDQVATFVPFKDGGIDIDTSTDYKNLAK